MRPAVEQGAGFALPELLVATALTLILASAVLGIVVPSATAFRRQPALTEMQQRARAAAELIGSRVLGAGGGHLGSHALLGIEIPCLLPYRVGRDAGSAPLPADPPAISILSVLPGSVPAALQQALLPSQWTAVLSAGSCPPAFPPCGIRAGATVMIAGRGGTYELLSVSAAAGPVLTLEARGPRSGRAFAPGSIVLPLDPATFYLRRASGLDPPQLRRADAGDSDMPLLDHVVAFSTEYFGESQPPRMRAPGSATASTTYGPLPPHDGEDDIEDSWGPGENCVFSRVDGLAVARLAVLAANETALVPMSSASLTDGPWCPDAASPTRFDADLLRVRKVRVSLRFEVASASLRGLDPRLFLRPGYATSAFVPDQELSFEVVPRGIGGGT